MFTGVNPFNNIIPRNMLFQQARNTIGRFGENPLAVPALLFLLLIISSFAFNSHKKDYRYDAAGYYAYLPAALIYDDLSFEFHQEAAGYPREEFYRGEEGRKLNKYGLGPAFLQAPFFLVGHLAAKYGNSPVTGFSKPYQLTAALGALFYFAAGLYILGLLLRQYFSPAISNLTLMSIGLGTNLFYYSTEELMMSHVYSFFLFAALMWLGMQWKKEYQTKYFLLICLIGGVIASVRITNVIFLIFPFLWGVRNFADAVTALRKVFGRPLLFFCGLILLLLPLLPQVWYIYSRLGDLSNPYGTEPFFWSEPLVHKVLFSWRKGWFVYTPIMIFSFIGWIYGRRHPAFWATVGFMILNLYIVSSWWCWWYGGGFGMRALIESAAPMSIGLAFCIQRFWNRQKIITVGVISLCIILNIFQSYQYTKGIIHHDAMTRGAYRAVFGKMHPLSPAASEERNKHLDYTDNARTMRDAEFRRGQ